MSGERNVKAPQASAWRRWREAAFATCTVWLVLQNVALLALATWGHPASALAAGTQLARTVITVGGQLCMLALAVALGFALVAWLVHAPAGTRSTSEREVGHER
jgi:hypothetical protein